MEKTSAASTMGLLDLLFKASLFVSVAKCAIEYEAAELDKPLNLAAIADAINNDPDAGWTAEVSELFSNVTLRDIGGKGGLIFPPDEYMSNAREEIPDPELEAYLKQLPESFDARNNWNCPSMWRILQQGYCGSCWAFSAVQVLQDRLCINFGEDVSLSPNNILTCCTKCGNCTSGYLHETYNYLQFRGTVSEECSPYFDTTSCPLAGCTAPACQRSCEDGSQITKRYYTSGRWYRTRTVAGIKNEIMTKGPVSTVLEAYEDLLTYKSGVYQHLKGKFILGHAVKLVGWGTTPQGEEYWIATNQWSPKWGESLQNGHFRIRLGVNECKVEAYVIAANPLKPSVSLVSDV